MKLLDTIVTALEKWFMALPTTPPPAGASLQERVAAIILQKNNALKFASGLLTNTAKGTAIHQIDSPEAAILAGIILTTALDRKMPLAYLLACIDIESCFDPGAINGNFAGSNLSRAPEGYDDGVAQQKLKYLIGSEGIKTVDDARAFALDPTKAIPYMVHIMEARLAWADKTIAGFNGDSSVLPQFRNRYYLATGAYNFGEKGMSDMLALPIATPPNHCEIVKALEQSFAKTLGEPSVFADITG